ncbi:AMP-dependent synthetase/ligase [Geoalkalibacter sp.]|uniref:AMP-dependent synthetase/ligase n=1 Tax=Geoalkalibacter sp. TaxID=3041440 RepID=UPI00272E921D|nr:AMP-binding protein [Geoalkalibacter sp.]
MDTIDRLVQQSCRQQGDKAALREKLGGTWRDTTYSKLEEQATKIGAGLCENGFRAGRQAALLAAPSTLWVSAYLGILKAGGVVIPIDKELKASEIRHILSDCQARFLFTEPQFLEIIREISPSLPSLETIVLLRSGRTRAAAAPSPLALPPGEDLDALSQGIAELAQRHGFADGEADHLLEIIHRLRARISPLPPTDKKPEEGKKSLRQLLARSEAPDALPIVALAEFLGEPENLPSSPRRAEDTAMILYTSGTTGRSKGAMLSHGNVISNIHAAREIFNLNAQMRTLSFLPINHVYELVCGILLPLSVGGTISFAESLKQLSGNLAEVKPSFLLGVPAVFQRLHDRIRKGIDDKPLARLLFRFGPTRGLVTGKVRQSLGDGTIFVSGGAALDPAVADGLAQLGVDVYQGYGITETSPIVAAERPGLKKLGTVGLPLPGVQVRIEDPNGEGVGEIWVKGPNVMQGYFNNPRATAEVLTDGWYHTGDLGSIDEQGLLSIRGRVKNLIVTPNGKNVYPEEVENELLKSPFIAEAMVYGHKVTPSAEEVHALIVPDQEHLDDYVRQKGLPPLNMGDVEALIRAEVVNACRQLADFKRVKKFTLREEELPKTTTRKIKRFAVEAEIPAASSAGKSDK